MARVSDSGVGITKSRGGHVPGNGTSAVPGYQGKPMRDTRAAMAREPDRIGRFLQDVLVGIQPGGAPARLVLRHVEPNSKVGALIGQQDISDMSVDSIHDVAMGVYEKAENDAAGLGRGTQRYVVQAFLAEDPAEEPVRVVFQIGGDNKSNESYVDSDPPNEMGLLQMLMSERREHNERQGEQVEMSMMMVKAFRDIAAEMAGEIRSMRVESRENFEAVQKATSEIWKREREEKELEAKVSVQRELASGIRLMLPAVARRIGAIDPKMPIPADEAALAAVVGSFTQDQLERFMSSDIFSDAQKVSLLEVVHSNIAKQEAGAPVLPPVTTPEAPTQ